VFLVNSRHSRFHDTKMLAIKQCTAAHHLPKLRSYFAEFLRYCFPNRFSIQCQPTCVGFGYGYKMAYLFSCAEPPRKTGFVNCSRGIKAEGGCRENSLAQTFVIYKKLPKRPPHKLKDYLHKVKPGVKTTAILHTVNRYLYQHWLSYNNHPPCPPNGGGEVVACFTTNSVTLFRCFGELISSATLSTPSTSLYEL